MLLYYGGLSLNLTDKNNKIPYDLAAQNKAKKILDQLTFFKDKRVNFLNLEADRLLSGDVITEDPTKPKDHQQYQIDKKGNNLIKA